MALLDRPKISVSGSPESPESFESSLSVHMHGAKSLQLCPALCDPMDL